MSYSTLYRVFKTKVDEMAEYGNSHGTAPVIWGHLNKTQLGKDANAWLFGKNDDLWKLARDPKVPRHLRLCMAFTLDRCICPHEKAGELADALELTYSETAPLNPNHVNHWKAIADDLRKVKKVPRTIGYGLNCTSVCNIWYDYVLERARKKCDLPFDLVAYVDEATP